MSLYRDIISGATGETDKVKLQMIENVMRDSVFHSTLDWQTRKQLERGARVAAKVLTEVDADTLTFLRDEAASQVV